LFLPAEFAGGSAGVRGAESTSALDGKNRVSPPGVKNIVGTIGRPRITSSLRYRKCSARSAIRCSRDSIACELNVGSRPVSPNTSRWLTTVTSGRSVSSQAGTWLSVTRKIRRTQGA
jgi:hypothetical protein